MNTSLQKLLQNLPIDKYQFLKEYFRQHYTLFFDKGVYPYEYITSFEKFDERQLPPKEAFYSSLTDEHISDEEYQHAQKV